MKAPGDIRAIVFDFDGTLAKLNIDFNTMKKEVLKIITSYGVPVDGLKDLYVLEMIDQAGSLIGKKDVNQRNRFIRQANNLISMMEIEAARKGELIEETREMLTELKDRAIKTAVITRNCGQAIRVVFHDIERYCALIMTRENIRYVKPNPQHLLSALAFLNVPPVYACMVGDHPIDIKTGKAAGTLTVGVLTGYATREVLTDTGADIILNKASEILSILA